MMAYWNNYQTAIYFKLRSDSWKNIWDHNQKVVNLTEWSE